MANADQPRLAVTSAWSFGRNRRMAADLEELFVEQDLIVCDHWSDPDLNRTEITMIGPERNHGTALLFAAELALPSIDLNRHAGSHSRVGALDSVRFEPLDGEAAAGTVAETFARNLAERLRIPVHFDGPGSAPGSEARILRLREAGFGGLTELASRPDFGPDAPHESWGTTIVTAGPRFVSAWVDLADPTVGVASQVAERLTELRDQGDDLLWGVRVVGWALPTMEASRVGLVFEMPERAPFDAVVALVGKEARLRGGAPLKAFARGLWRPEEAARASRFVFGRKQVLEDVYD